MCIDKKELITYKTLNNIAKRNSVVIIGSDYMKEMQVGELKQVFGILTDVYNRSFSNLSIFEAKEIISATINELVPKKIIIQLGENDLASGSSVETILDEYNEILKSIKKQDKHLKIVVVSLNSNIDKAIEKEFNSRLENLCSSLKCQFVSIASTGDNDISRINTFRALRYFISDDVFAMV